MRFALPLLILAASLVTTNARANTMIRDPETKFAVALDAVEGRACAVGRSFPRIPACPLTAPLHVLPDNELMIELQLRDPDGILQVMKALGRNQRGKSSDVRRQIARAYPNEHIESQVHHRTINGLEVEQYVLDRQAGATPSPLDEHENASFVEVGDRSFLVTVRSSRSAAPAVDALTDDVVKWVHVESPTAAPSDPAWPYGVATAVVVIGGVVFLARARRGHRMSGAELWPGARR
jgi:hypothetical protein